MPTPISLFEMYCPQGPHPHVHILPCPYYTRAVRADSLYSRGEWGEDAVGGPLWSPVQCLHPSPYLQCIAHKGCQENSLNWQILSICGLERIVCLLIDSHTHIDTS